MRDANLPVGRSHRSTGVFRAADLLHLLGIYQAVLASRPLEVGNREFLESLLADSRTLGRALARAPSKHGGDPGELAALLAAIAAQEPVSAATRAQTILDTVRLLQRRAARRQDTLLADGELPPLRCDYARVTVLFGPGLGLGDQITFLPFLRALQAQVPDTELTVFTVYPGLWTELFPQVHERTYRRDPLRPFRYLQAEGTPGRELVVAADFGANHLHGRIVRSTGQRDVLEIALGLRRAWLAQASAGLVRTECWPAEGVGGNYGLLASLADRLCPRDVPWPAWEAVAPLRRPRRRPLVLMNPLSSKRLPFLPQHWATVLRRLNALLGGIRVRVYPGVHPASREDSARVAELACKAGIDAALLDEGEGSAFTATDGLKRVCRAAREADVCLTVDTFTAHLVPLLGIPTVTVSHWENRDFWVPARWSVVRVVPTPDAPTLDSLAEAVAVAAGGAPAALAGLAASLVAATERAGREGGPEAVAALRLAVSTFLLWDGASLNDRAEGEAWLRRLSRLDRAVRRHGAAAEIRAALDAWCSSDLYKLLWLGSLTGNRRS
ncbi:MAG TPA: hypothetical protein VHG28_23165 [Longimicrobiaceae bacterium]|nr:hypothetical protein [Longimicrobiaceae bacterium]